MKKLDIFLLLVALVTSLVLRLYKIDNPVADWHSFRQADTASVTEQFISHGVNLLVPTYHDLSNIQSGKDNPKGYRMVEFPLYNLAHYWVYQINPKMGVDMAGRATSVIFSLISLIFVFLIGRKLSGLFVGWLAAMFFAVLPFSIYFSRTILPEPLMVCLLLSSYYTLLKTGDSKGIGKRLYFYLSSLLVAGALLVKPFAAFFLLPHLGLILRYIVQEKLTLVDALLYGGISAGPLLWWRKHILAYPEGIPASDWLLNSSGIRFRPAWFRWLFAERLGRLILGIYGTTFLVLGLISKPKHEGVTYWLWFLGILAYFSVVAGGNVQHDYYQVITLPFICFLLAKGFSLLIGLSRTTYSRWLTILMSVVALMFMIGLSWYDIEPNFHINNPAIIAAGKAVAEKTPQDALVIAPYNGDTAFLYQTRRSGWPLGFYISDKINKGAQYYVSVVYDDEARELEKKYTVIEKNKDFILIKLSK